MCGEHSLRTKILLSFDNAAPENLPPHAIDCDSRRKGIAGVDKPASCGQSVWYARFLRIKQAGQGRGEGIAWIKETASAVQSRLTLARARQFAHHW